jgi:hypothetical protein
MNKKEDFYKFSNLEDYLTDETIHLTTRIVENINKYFGIIKFNLNLVCSLKIPSIQILVSLSENSFNLAIVNNYRNIVDKLYEDEEQ